jgi:DNA-binding CsgD family transcriptional regulator/PAS domain-containing protein
LATARIDFVSTGHDPTFVARYNEHYFRIDPFRAEHAGAALGMPFVDQMVIPRSVFVASEIYNDWARPQGYDFTLGCAILNENGFSVESCLIRPPGTPAFDRHDVDAYARLVPHLRQAFRIQQRLTEVDAERQAALDVLDRRSQGVILVNAAGNVVYLNRAAEKICGSRDGLLIDGGRLGSRDVGVSARLNRLIAEAIGREAQDGAGGFVRVPRLREPEPLIVLVAPLRSRPSGWLMHVAPAAVVFITDPAKDARVSEQQLRRLFDLTPAEAAVAAEICRGAGIKAAAARLGVTRATVRTHLAHVFEKTETSRQAELVRRIMALAGMIDHG